MSLMQEGENSILKPSSFASLYGILVTHSIENKV